MGLKEVPEIERVHVFARKRYLNAVSQTPDTMVYGETGRCLIKSVECWLRVVMVSQERHTRKAYNDYVNKRGISMENSNIHF